MIWWGLILVAIGTAKGAGYPERNITGRDDAIKPGASFDDEIVVSGAGAHCYHIRGVPKSGTTWLTALLAECSKRSCLDAAQAAQAELCHRPRNCGTNILNSKHEKGQDEVLHAHGKTVFIFRDTRDVITSAFHWSAPPNVTLRAFATGTQGSIKVVTAQNAFMKNVDAMKASSPGKGISTFYEDLLADPYKEAMRLTEFIGMTLTRRMIVNAVNESSFNSMRVKEEQGKLRLLQHPDSVETLRNAQRNKDPKALFGVMTRKGVAGGWRDEMNPATQEWVESDMRSNLDKRLRLKFLGGD